MKRYITLRDIIHHYAIYLTVSKTRLNIGSHGSWSITKATAIIFDL